MDLNQRLEYHQNSLIFLSVFLCIMTLFSIAGCLFPLVSFAIREEDIFLSDPAKKIPGRNFCPLLSQSLWPGGGIAISPA